MREGSNQRSIWVAAAALAGTILFRVNTGKAWVSGAGPAKRFPGGDILVPSGRQVSLGFGLISGQPVVGVADLCGWRSVVVTPDMVGCRLAVFVSIECKASGGGKTSDDQRRWRDTVIAAGGIAGVASSDGEAIAIFNAWRPARRPE